MQQVLMLGHNLQKSSPYLTLAKGLRSLGYDPVFSNNAEINSTREWIRLCMQASVLVVVKYDRMESFFIRQLAIAGVLGLPIIRWWVGTDVFNVLNDLSNAESVRSTRWLFSRQIAVSPHLVDELKIVGVRARYIPSVIELDESPRILDKAIKTILVYLPTKRRAFYRADIIEDAVRAYPDLEFIIVADEEHSLDYYPNVRSVGWTEEMAEIWDATGCLLRVTKHDGMPRMVLEALRRGKHVIYSWPFPGCVRAKSQKEVFHALDHFREQTLINSEGVSLVQDILTPNPLRRFHDEMNEMTKNWNIAVRILSVIKIVNFAIKKNVKNLLPTR